MSYAAVSHIQYRLEPRGAGTRLVFHHRAIGMIDPDHRVGVQSGWNHLLERTKRVAEKR